MIRLYHAVPQTIHFNLPIHLRWTHSMLATNPDPPQEDVASLPESMYCEMRRGEEPTTWWPWSLEKSGWSQAQWFPTQRVAELCDAASDQLRRVPYLSVRSAVVQALFCSSLSYLSYVWSYVTPFESFVYEISVLFASLWRFSKSLLGFHFCVWKFTLPPNALTLCSTMLLCILSTTLFYFV